MIRELTDVFELGATTPRSAWSCSTAPANAGSRAGGDIRELYGYATNGNAGEAREFFRAEYRLDAMIARYPKPVVAIMDGITMGGGIGLAGHAAIRVVTERSRVAMPETRIGFTPDVGGSWLLARAPGELGVHLALNSRTMDAADALHAGFADSFVPVRSAAAPAAGARRAGRPRQPRRDRHALRRDPGPVGAGPRTRLGRRLLLGADGRRDHRRACGRSPRGRPDARVQLVPAASARPGGIRVRGRRGRGARDALADGAHGHARVGASRPNAAQPRGGARAGVPRSCPGSSSSTTCARASARR